MIPKRKPDELRSHRWYGAEGMRAFAHRQRMQQMGLRREEFVGRPVIGVVNTWSDLSPCHAHLRERAETVKRGIWRAGGVAVELPVDEAELGRRREAWRPPPRHYSRGYGTIHQNHVTQAHEGCDFDLLGPAETPTPEPEIY